MQQQHFKFFSIIIVKTHFSVTHLSLRFGKPLTLVIQHHLEGDFCVSCFVGIRQDKNKVLPAWGGIKMNKGKKYYIITRKHSSLTFEKCLPPNIKPKNNSR